MSNTARPTEKQLEALLLAYADGFCCELQGDIDGDFAPHPRTIRALLRKELVEPDPAAPSLARPTDAGRAALGIAGLQAPDDGDATATIRRAVAVLVDPDVVVYGPDDGVAMPVHDEGEYNWDGLLALVERPPWRGNDEVRFAAAATLATEWNLACYSEVVNGHWVALWPAEDAD